jgi:nicotinamide-nucleotide amidase
MADHDSILKLATALVDALSSAGKVVTTAESCTGGWAAKAITDVPGSSNSAKESFLGVQNATLEEHGSVSEPVVTEMAEGSLNLSGADIAVAISGIAGPDGGSEEKPVGTVWFAWAIRNHGKVHIETGRQHFDGDRDLIRELAVVYALQGVIDRL